MPSGSSGPPDPAGVGIDRGQRDAGDRGRQRERQVDQRADQPLGREIVAHQHPGDEQAEHAVDRRRDHRRAEATAGRRRARASREGGVAEDVPALADALDEHRAQRDQHDEREPEDRDAQRQRRSPGSRRADVATLPGAGISRRDIKSRDAAALPMHRPWFSIRSDRAACCRR